MKQTSKERRGKRERRVLALAEAARLLIMVWQFWSFAGAGSQGPWWVRQGHAGAPHSSPFRDDSQN